MATLQEFERGNTIKVVATFNTSSNVATDPSGNVAFIQVFKPDGTSLIGGGSGAITSRTGTGSFKYFFDTADDYPLGVYVVQWQGYHGIGTLGGVVYGYKPVKQRDSFVIVDTEAE